MLWKLAKVLSILLAIAGIILEFVAFLSYLIIPAASVFNQQLHPVTQFFWGMRHYVAEPQINAFMGWGKENVTAENINQIADTYPVWSPAIWPAIVIVAVLWVVIRFIQKGPQAFFTEIVGLLVQFGSQKSGLRILALIVIPAYLVGSVLSSGGINSYFTSEEIGWLVGLVFVGVLLVLARTWIDSYFGKFGDLVNLALLVTLMAIALGTISSPIGNLVIQQVPQLQGLFFEVNQALSSKARVFFGLFGLWVALANIPTFGPLQIGGQALFQPPERDQQRRRGWYIGPQPQAARNAGNGHNGLDT